MNKPFVNPPAQSTVNVRELVTPRGVTAWLVEDYAVPLVSLEFAFRGGASQDPAGKAGAATMLAGLLDEGAGDLDNQAFQRALDEKAIEMSFHAERDHISGRMRTLTRNLDRAGDLLKLAINAPALDEEPFERVREQMNARLRHDAKDPSTMAGKAWRQRVFPGHAYAQASDGEVETLAAIAREDLKAMAQAAGARRAACRRGRRDRSGPRGAPDRRGLRRPAPSGRHSGDRLRPVRGPRRRRDRRSRRAAIHDPLRPPRARSARTRITWRASCSPMCSAAAPGCRRASSARCGRSAASPIRSPPRSRPSTMRAISTAARPPRTSAPTSSSTSSGPRSSICPRATSRRRNSRRARNT